MYTNMLVSVTKKPGEKEDKLVFPHTKINFAGPSGIGKTTMAKWLSKELNIPFVSGSYSDLIPSTASMYHRDMISKDPQEIHTQDTQLLNLRNKLFGSYPEMVSDRSYLDSAAYHINKLSHHLKECDTDSFIDICKSLTLVTISHLIVLPLSIHSLKKWEMEDNKKRVLNRYYQREISTLLLDQLNLWDLSIEKTERVSSLDISDYYYKGYLKLTKEDKTFYTHVLVVNSIDMDERKAIIKEWLADTMTL